MPTVSSSPKCHALDDVVIGHGESEQAAYVDARMSARGPIVVLATSEIAGHHTVLARPRA